MLSVMCVNMSPCQSICVMFVGMCMFVCNNCLLCACMHVSECASLTMDCAGVGEWLVPCQ